MAIAVKRDGCTDYILSAPEGTTHDLGPVSITGKFAYASIDNQGNLQRAYLLCGTELRCGSHTLTLPQAQTPLDVTSVDNRTYHISANRAQRSPRNLSISRRHRLRNRIRLGKNHHRTGLPRPSRATASFSSTPQP